MLGSIASHTMAFLLLIILCSVVSAVPVPLATCPVVLPTHATPRIVGGDEASPHTRSHIVSFYEEGCGGSLLSGTWVLTAAHCLVHAGSMARISGTNSSNGLEIPVKRVFDHPNYQFPKDDITLVELESPAPSSTSFMAVNSNPSVPEDGEFARVAGYGFQGEGFDHEHDAMLRQVDVPVMNTQKCIERYFSVHSYLREDISAEKHLCAGYDRGGCDSCTADSGGPLFVYDEENSPVQIAIVSFGYGCAREVPGGYTRASTYVPWMRSVGAVFEEKSTRKSVFGDTVSGASDPGSDEEEEEEPNNEGTSEPAPEQAPTSPAPEQAPASPAPEQAPASPAPEQAPVSPEAVTSQGPTTSSGPVASEAPTDSPVKPDSSPQPTVTGNLTGPKPSPRPTPPGRLPPNHAVGTPAVDRPPSSLDAQGGHGGEGRPRPVENESVSSSGDDDSDNAGGSPGGDHSDAGQNDDDSAQDDDDSAQNDDDAAENDDGAAQNDGDAAQSEDESGENDTEAPEQEGDDDNDSDTTTEDENGDNDSMNNSPENNGSGGPNTPESNGSVGPNTPESNGSVGPNTPENNGSVGPSAPESEGVVASAPNDSDEDSDSSNASDSDSKEPTDGADSTNNEGSSGNVIGPVLAPGPSPEVLMPTSQMGMEDEELEPSSSPEVTETPEDDSDANSEAGEGEGEGLSGLQISMIVVGVVLALSAVGFLVYFIIQKVM